MAFPSPYYRWRPHPWHGLGVGDDAPSVVQAYIEITPFDTVKYEIDKQTGYLRVDRPQRTSSSPPMLYGFVPQTYCGQRCAALSPTSSGGDHDPLDICVLSERPIDRVEILLEARVIGGLQMVDDGEADDKIVAVLRNDHVWREAKDISDIPAALIERLQHYFETYKLRPGGVPSAVVIEQVYGREHAEAVVRACMEDYVETFGN
jgi:inorganic pyrophosphatase